MSAVKEEKHKRSASEDEPIGSNDNNDNDNVDDDNNNNIDSINEISRTPKFVNNRATSFVRFLRIDVDGSYAPPGKFFFESHLCLCVVFFFNCIANVYLQRDRGLKEFIIDRKKKSLILSKTLTPCVFFLVFNFLNG